jgi:hypothetical protein
LNNRLKRSYDKIVLIAGPQKYAVITERCTMRISIWDIFFMIAFTLWVTTLNLHALSTIQKAAMGAMGLWLVFLVYRLVKKPS